MKYILISLLLLGCGEAYSPSNEVFHAVDAGLSDAESLPSGVYIGRCDLTRPSGTQDDIRYHARWNGNFSNRSIHVVACSWEGDFCPLLSEDCQGCEHLPNEDFVEIDSNEVRILCGQNLFTDGKREEYIFHRIMMDVR